MSGATTESKAPIDSTGSDCAQATASPPRGRRGSQFSNATLPQFSQRGNCEVEALRAGAGQKAADLGRSVGVHVRPHHGRTVPVRLRDQSRLGNNNPFAMQPHAITAVLNIPIDILYFEPVGKRTTQAFAARQLIKPRVKWLIGIAAVITRRYIVRNQNTHAQRYNRQQRTGESVHRGLQMIVLRGSQQEGPADLERKLLPARLLLIRIDSWKATSVPFNESRQ